MKILVLGANGKVGSKVTLALLQKGHTVVAGVHKSKERVPEGAELVPIDITDQASIEANLRGCDAVVCALSSWQAPAHNVLGQAMRVLIPAMQQTKVRRIISISGDAARVPNEKPAPLVRMFHAVAFGAVGKVVRDSEKHIRLLYDSDLEWTVLRPGIMTSSSSAAYQLRSTHPRGVFVTRNAVVAAIVDLVESPTHVGEAPFICNT